MAKRKIVDKAKSLGYYVEANSGLLSYGEMVGLAIKTVLNVLTLTKEGRESIYREGFLEYTDGADDEAFDEDKGEFYCGD